MSKDAAQRFNLVFAGQLSPGTDPVRARRALAGFFGLQDGAAVEVFFGGRPVPLRRNLTRDEAQRLYRQLRELGLICEIPRVDARPAAPRRERAAAPTSTGAKPRQRVRAGTRPTAPDFPRGVKSAVAGPADSATAHSQAPGPGPSRQPKRATRTAPEPARHAVTVTAPAEQASPDPWPDASTPRGAAPNLFALRPAITRRPDPALREQQQLRALVAAAAAFALVLVVVAVSLRFPAAPAGPEPRGPLAAASRPGGELIMLQPQALLLHRRSGLALERIDASTLGLATLAPPLFVTADGAVLLGARSESGDYRLLRCDLGGPTCDESSEDLPLEGPPALAESYLGDALFLLSRDGRLLRRDATGATTADSALPARTTPRLAYHDGLLLAPAADAPLLGVFRPDHEGFGTQIDALLLSAPADGSPAQRVVDFAMGTDARWAILERDGGRDLYRFDRQWGSPQRIGVPVGDEAFLVPWRDRILVADTGSGSAARLAPDGRREADLVSEMLAGERAEWRRITSERKLRRRVGIILPLAVAALALLYALLQGCATRSLSAPVHGSTSILDPMPGNIHWLPAQPRRDRPATRLGVLLMVLALLPAVVLLAAGDWRAALAFLPVIAAALYARGALARGLGGHLGFRGKEAVVIDYDGRYFFGPRTLLRRGAGFVFAPGVALPIAPPLLPNMAQVDESAAAPLADLASALGLLWQLRHPWLFALVAMILGGLLSLTCALLAG